jgi:hypothetical protein
MIFIRETIAANEFGIPLPTGKYEVTGWDNWWGTYYVLDTFDTRADAVAYRKVLWDIEVKKQNGYIPFADLG